MRALRAALIALAALAAGWGAAAQTRTPVVVELFTSQGCSACPEANERLARLTAERDDVLLLSFSVDYWDYLGWRDTLAQPAFSERQRAYTRRLALRRLSTPQVVVGGVRAASGSDGDVARALEAGVARGVDVRLAEDGSRVWVGSGRAPQGGAEVWLVRYDPAVRTVQVADGETRGREVRVPNSVQALVRLGAWRGRAAVWRLPPEITAGLRTAVLLQGADGGPVLGAASD